MNGTNNLVALVGGTSCNPFTLGGLPAGATFEKGVNMSKEKHVELFGFHGHGASMADAKADAERQVQAALSGPTQPKVVVWKGQIGIAWCSLGQICTSYCDSEGKLRGLCLHGAGTTIESAVRGLKYSLAQLNADFTEDMVPAIIADDPEMVREFLGWLGFQRAYRAAPGTDSVKHAWAYDHGREFIPQQVKAA